MNRTCSKNHTMCLGYCNSKDYGDYQPRKGHAQSTPMRLIGYGEVQPRKAV
jgi:hypothetical protein